MTSAKRWLTPTLLVAGVALVLWHLWLSLGSWYIDDSAISLAYARNLVRGHGLVAQIGDAPVEGFSNPLWVALEALVMWTTGWFSLAVPRVLALVLMAVLVTHICWNYRRSTAIMCGWLLALLLCLLQPAIGIWSLSGLENGLLLFLGFELAMQLMEPSFGDPWKVSAICAAMALTRPDAILYSMPYPVLVVLIRRFKLSRLDMVNIAKSLSIVVIAVGCYLGFRLVYFGSLFPNTYYAKGQPAQIALTELLMLGFEMRKRLISALFALFGGATAWLIVFGCWFAYVKRATVPAAVRWVLPVLTIGSVAAFCYAYLPNDWMPCFRFATLFMAAIYIALALCIFRYWTGVKLLCPLLLTIGISCFNHWLGVRDFMSDRPIMVADVQYRGEYFSRWGKMLGIDKPVVMTADAGGILWDEKVRLLDLGMLCDSTIARCLGEHYPRHDYRRFWDYVFDEKKPDFIATRAFHSFLPRFESDPRFRRDYIPIYEYPDMWVLERRHLAYPSGDYVRRDLIEEHALEYEKMKEESQSNYYACRNSAIVFKR